MKPLLLIFALLAAGCSDNVVRSQYCSEEKRQEAANFVLLCAEAANPMSDEEPEDMIKQCQITAKELVCEQGFTYFSPSSAAALTIVRSCKSARTAREKKFCGVE